MTDQLIYNYISGEASEQEKEAVKKWAAESEERQKELSRIKNIWILSGLNNEINPEQKQQAIQQILARIKELNNTPERKTIQLNGLKYAAIIVLVALFSGTIGYFVFQSKNNIYQSAYTEIIVPNGERSTVVLPDGSKVQLNSGSILKFKSSFDSNNRTVSLDGEGYFEVSHDKSKPFFVETTNFQVEVLGTKFNVSSYTDDANTTAYLESGKVKINLEDGQSILLKPTESTEYNKTTNTIRKFAYDDSRYTDWTRGILTFNGETIEELSKKLERRFGVQIAFSDDTVKQRIYTGSIKDQDLKTVLEAIKFTSSLNYTKAGNQITIYSAK